MTAPHLGQLLDDARDRALGRDIVPPPAVVTCRHPHCRHPLGVGRIAGRRTWLHLDAAGQAVELHCRHGITGSPSLTIAQPDPESVR